MPFAVLRQKDGDKFSSVVSREIFFDTNKIVSFELYDNYLTVNCIDKEYTFKDVTNEEFNNFKLDVMAKSGQYN